MYNKRVVYGKTDLEVNQSTEGETIENRIERVLNNEEPITDKAPYIETEIQEGVIPMYDIRTDPFDMALDELTSVHEHSAGEYAKKIAEINKDLSSGGTDTGEGDASEA